MPSLFEELSKNNKQPIMTPQPSGSGSLFSQFNKNEQNQSPAPNILENPFDTGALQKSIDNAKLRIQDAGGNVSPDRRNGVEKFLNLPEDQNWLFDTLEVIGRPQQALYQWFKGKLDKKPGSEITKDTIKGFKGTAERESGSKLLNEYAGLENKYGRAIGGFGIDVVSDPLNLIPGAAFTKIGKGVGKGVSAGTKALDKTTDIIPGVKGLKENTLAPALNSAKEGLGSMFKYQYGWDRTLTGGKDDTLKNLYNQTENQIKYMSENSLKDVTGAAKSAGGVKTGDDVGRLMEKNQAVYGPALRPFSTDPKITKAADDLVKSNDTLRQWAIDNDIPVGEIDGYMRHILSAEEQALRKRAKPGAIDRPMSGMNNPDKKILQGRKLQGTAEDINQEIGRKFFEPNAYFSTAVGQRKLIEYGNAVKFRREVLDNPNFATKRQPGVDPPPGSEIINTNNYEFLKNPANPLPDKIGGEYIVTKGVKSALERYQKLTTDDGINAFLKMYDTGLGAWKRLALLSGGYHLRNDIGAKFNNYVAGMDTPDILKYSSMAMKDIKDAMSGKGSALYDLYRKEGLSSTSQNAVEFAKHGSNPEKAITNAVKRDSRSTGRKVAGVLNPLRATENSQAAGNVVDQVNRFALFRWAVEKKGMLPEQAAAKVRETQFDYSRNTNFEKGIATRVVPFYRWSRNNIPFQLRKFAEDPARYSRVDKLRRNFQDSFGLEEKDTPDYMKQNFFMPITGNGDGSGRMLGANLPVGDLTRLSSPGKLGLDSLAGPLKLLGELPSNRNLFYGNEIQGFEGQAKKYRIPEKIYGIDIPGGGKKLGGLPVKMAYALEQLGGQPARGLSKMLGVPTQQELENQSLKPSLGISSLLKPYDIKETNYRAKQKELRELEDMIYYLEQELGQRPRSVRDIKRGR